MLRSLLLVSLVVSGCVETGEDHAPAPRIEVKDVHDKLVTLIPEPDQPDLCALAEQLDSDDVCSLMCDPPAMADFLIAGGMTGGKCVQLVCNLPTLDEPVFVGVCLPL